MLKLPFHLTGQDAGDLSIFNYDIEQIMNRNKVVIDQFVLSFVIQGRKDVYNADFAAQIDNTKVLLIAEGNYLITENCVGSQDYKSILLFFSKSKITSLLIKMDRYSQSERPIDVDKGYFTMEQDDFVKVFISSLEMNFKLHHKLSRNLLEIKFEEIMIYLLHQYRDTLTPFLLQTLQNDRDLSFKRTIEANRYTNLRTRELAFLCNMSISTFKRRFNEVFGETPGQWFKASRLEHARQLLASGKGKPSDLLQSSGYKNLSHFSTAYKHRFGKSPSRVNEN